MATLNRTDLEFILQQINMAEAGQPPVNPHLPFGLRQVAGTANNLVDGQSTFGSVDQPFPRMTTPVFQSVTVNIDGTMFDPHPGVAGDTATTSYASTSSSPYAAVIDGAPRTISNLISDQSVNNPAALEAAQNFAAQLGAGYTILPANPPIGPNGTVFGTEQSLFIGNITPDTGLSAPFNSWMTLFGQFFDHGLDLVQKGGSGTVLIPLAPDDPLRTVGPDGVAGTGDEVPANLAFMALTRATNLPGADGLLGTADDVHENVNTVTPFIDQNQTYTSHPSHQVFLREWTLGSDGKIHATGDLLNGRTAGADGKLFTADDVLNKGMATWGVVKAAAAATLGIVLSDSDVGNVPLLVTDAYGNLALDAAGRVQIVVDVSATDASGAVTVTQHLVKAAPGTPIDINHLTIGSVDGFTPVDGLSYSVAVVRTGHAFLNDIAHGADPTAANYDNALLDAHYIAGDGRANENFGLTAVHEVFHAEHNRLIDQIKSTVLAELAKGDTSFALNWVLPGTDLSSGVIADDQWNGERLFQAAKFGTETQYQHLVFEEFARKISPGIHLFGNTNINLDPAITAEFAHAVYRFGHSMLDENLPRFKIQPATLPDGSPNPLAGTPVLDDNGQPVLSDTGLIEAFLNPLAYAAQGADAAGQVVLGTTHQIGNEIDEFVTGALRNNLLGLPLDLAALNIARGRETGVAPLNVLRAQLFSQTGDTALKPYASWDEFGQFLKHPASLINFVAAYGTHQSVLAATTLEGKRAAALALVTDGLDPTSNGSGDALKQDAFDFMHSLGAYANDKANALAVHADFSTGSITGLDSVDLWIGGLAEKQNLFGGLLGSTFDFIFRTQLESLQDGDRLYYLPRIEGLHWASEIEGNTFADLIMRNLGIKHLPASIFQTPEYTVESSQIGDDPSTWLKNPITGATLVEKLTDTAVHALVDGEATLPWTYVDAAGVTHDGFDTQVHFIGDDNFLGNTIVLGGTDGRDILISGNADDDTVWADAGNDYVDGGNGNDRLFGGDGNDVIKDSAGNDIIHGNAGDDVVFAGNGDDIVFGDDGDDILDGGQGLDELSGGLGNDIIRGGEGDDALTGNDGDDWLEGGAGGDILVGDQGAPTGQIPLISGNDVLIGGSEGDRMQGFSGDDIMLGEGGFDTFDGRLGFDWASFERENHGVAIDMTRADFIANPPATGGAAIRDVFIQVEGASGTAYDDMIQGTNDIPNDPFNTLTNVNLVLGLDAFFPSGPVNFTGGNILLGGAGNDTIEGRGGNDIIDGDAYLHVELLGPSPKDGILRQILYDTNTDSIDTAVYSRASNEYTWTYDAATDAWTVQHINPLTQLTGIDGIDTLRHIERLQFTDGIFELSSGAPGNHVPFGTVDILGDTGPAAGVDPLIGSTLTADASTVFDPDGMGPLKYQWEMQDLARPLEWVPIAGATSADFTPTAFQNGTALRVAVSFVDGNGHTERVVSLPTNVVAFPPTVNTAPTIVAQKQLTGVPDTTILAGQNFSYWLHVRDTFADNQTPVNQLTYKVTLANGADLATVGLSYEVKLDTAGNVDDVRVFGKVADGTKGAIGLRITATDSGPGKPLSVTDDFLLNVLNVNHAPISKADSYTTAEDTELTVTAGAGVLFNDKDPDGNTLTASVVTGPAHGTLVLNTDGSFVYTPDANWAGDDSFTYRASDKSLSSADTLVKLTVTPQNDGEGIVTISGDLTVGSALTATLGPDPDGAPTSPILWQWLLNGDPIIGATDSTYVIAASDIGQSISVMARYLDGQNFFERPISEAVVIPDPGIVAVMAATDLTMTGTLGNDHLTGNALANSFFGLAGNDTILALGGRDTLTGGEGNDQLFGGTGNDRFIATVGDGNDTYDGGTGTDTYDLTLTSADTRVDLGAGTSQSDDTGVDVLISIENVDGSAGNNWIVGSDVSNLLNGNGGNDTLDGGHAGFDTLRGGTGDDTYRIDHAGVTVVETAGQGTDTAEASVSHTLRANVENLTLTGTAAINGTGNTLANVMTGNAADNLLRGLGGNDTFVAHVGDGNDTYDGGSGVDTIDLSMTLANAVINLRTGQATSADIGTDTLISIENAVGGGGNDTVIASTARNTLTGGAGADIFEFDTRQTAGNGASRDIIRDFGDSDKIDISRIKASALAGAPLKFVFDGEIAAGSEQVGHVGYHFETIGLDEYTVLEGNIRTGASTTETTIDFQIALFGHHTLAPDMVIL